MAKTPQALGEQESQTLVDTACEVEARMRKQLQASAS